MEEQKNTNTEYYKQYVQEINNRIKSNQESQDKMILTISVALFGLLPFLLEKTPINDFTTCAIRILLILNTLALISTLLSFYFCCKGNEKDIEYVEKYYLEENQEYFNKESCWTKLGKICNSVSLISFIVVLIDYAIIIGYYLVNKN